MITESLRILFFLNTALEGHLHEASGVVISKIGIWFVAVGNEEGVGDGKRKTGYYKRGDVFKTKQKKYINQGVPRHRP